MVTDTIFFMQTISNMQTNYIQNFHIQFHNSPTPINDTFGIVQLSIKEIAMNKQPIFLFFSSDISGSMSDICNDGRSKMDHSNHVIRNIFTLVADISSETEIWIQVDGFDDKIDKIIPAQKITPDRLEDLFHLLKRLRPRNSTNIELAMKNADLVMFQFQQEHPDFFISHLFTTDGNATSGNCNTQNLAQLVNPRFMNTFIGFGYDHSAKTLNTMANNINAQYYFIDNIERGGLVFGEIIHSILYRISENTVLQVKQGNAEIYNYKTNTWTTFLSIGYLIGETTKTYHIRCKDPSDIILQICGEDTTPLEPTDLTKYILRQTTQELLFEAQQYPVLNDFKDRIEKHLTELKKYMETHENDPIVITLHDDIVIVMKTFGTYYSDMFAIARANSTGRELSYNVSDIPPMQRCRGGFFADINPILWDNETPLLNPVPVNRSHSTPRQIEIMRSCSQPMDDIPSIVDENHYAETATMVI